MNKYYLAIDIGASSGRHILGHLKDGKLVLEEIYRFRNDLVHKNGHLVWDMDHLFEEVKNGIAKCKELGKIPKSMGIDTWGADFVLLDKDGKMLGDAIGYRDKRTEGMDEKLYEIISKEELYRRTGIQKLIINTIYHLLSVRLNQPELLEKAETFLMIPDYLNYLLTGVKKSEYTNATTTQLVNSATKQWDFELIEHIGIRTDIFLELSLPGSKVGAFTPEIEKEVGFSCDVVMVPSHDTASAVLAVPSLKDDFLYISSGTWSLMGTELRTANCSEKSRIANFTNEGGIEYRFRFLKNIMGLWMIQSIRKEYDDMYTSAELCDLAEEAKDFPSIVDANDNSFLVPDSMIQAVKDYCSKTDQQVPGTPGEIASVIYHSLAKLYGETVKQIEDLTGIEYDAIHVVGGGSKSDYLNRLTAQYTGKTVFAGPSEATAIGNLAGQMIAAGELKDCHDARRCIADSFEIKKYDR